MSGAGPEALVIGYGNDLRSDDGAGRVVADRVEALSLDDVTVRSLPQLVPELAAEIISAREVIFVDASIGDHQTLRTTAVFPDHDRLGLGHHVTPAGLLALAATLGGPVPPGVVVSVPAVELGLGAQLSATTAKEVARAVEVVRGLVSGTGRVAAGGVVETCDGPPSAR